MVLVLLKYNDFRMAVDMKHVSRIINLSPTMTPKERFLLPPGSSPQGILLKNDFIVPASKVEEMLPYDSEPTFPNTFLKGCTKKNHFQAFAVINQNVYGILAHNFLKIEELKQEE